MHRQALYSLKPCLQTNLALFVLHLNKSIEDTAEFKRDKLFSAYNDDRADFHPYQTSTHRSNLCHPIHAIKH